MGHASSFEGANGLRKLSGLAIERMARADLPDLAIQLESRS
jgi:hypothetical protein